ncbi:MAG: acyl carrier protein [Clostridiales bacterium]|nr:MAG: acyl carrier protein [Clostridiales bacterium]
MIEKLKTLFAERFDVDKDTITPETKIMEDLGADSLDVVDMLMTLEDDYNVTIPEEVAQSMKTVGDVADFLDKNVK